MSAPDSPLRALIVAYQFPPVGGAGVGRVVKLAKYLHLHGVVPSALTVSNPSVPLLDPSLAADLPGDLRVTRARTFEPAYSVKREVWSSVADRRTRWPSRLRARLVGAARFLLVPDPQLLWQPAAQLALLRLLRREQPDVVFISGPPFSQFLLGPTGRLGRAALVLDYRDEWSTYAKVFEMMSPLAARVGRHLERALLRRADAVTTATEAFRGHLLERFPFLHPERVRAIPNGFDPADFSESLPEPPHDRLVISYAGTVFRLTSARTLLGAVRRIHACAPELARLLELRFIGRIVETELPHFAGSESLGVRRLGYVEHGRLMPELSASHVVLCLLADEPGTERIYPSKIFELMRLGRPVLTLAPPGQLADLVRELQLGPLLAPHDEPAIADTLLRMLREFQAGRTPAASADRARIARYDRRALAGEFAEVFREALQRRRGRTPPAVGGVRP